MDKIHELVRDAIWDAFKAACTKVQERYLLREDVPPPAPEASANRGPVAAPAAAQATVPDAQVEGGEDRDSVAPPAVARSGSEGESGHDIAGSVRVTVPEQPGMEDADRRCAEDLIRRIDGGETVEIGDVERTVWVRAFQILREQTRTGSAFLQYLRDHRLRWIHSQCKWKPRRPKTTTDSLRREEGSTVSAGQAAVPVIEDAPTEGTATDMRDIALDFKKEWKMIGESDRRELIELIGKVLERKRSVGTGWKADEELLRELARVDVFCFDRGINVNVVGRVVAFPFSGQSANIGEFNDRCSAPERKIAMITQAERNLQGALEAVMAARNIQEIRQIRDIEIKRIITAWSRLWRKEHMTREVTPVARTHQGQKKTAGFIEQQFMGVPLRELVPEALWKRWMGEEGTSAAEDHVVVEPERVPEQSAFPAGGPIRGALEETAAVPPVAESHAAVYVDEASAAAPVPAQPPEPIVTPVTPLAETPDVVSVDERLARLRQALCDNLVAVLQRSDQSVAEELLLELERTRDSILEHLGRPLQQAAPVESAEAETPAGAQNPERTVINVGGLKIEFSAAVDGEAPPCDEIVIITVPLHGGKRAGAASA
ncbi:MAG: hypothetical protein V1926_04065 [Candidatus Peregrinibacteria bacterium]